MAIAGRPPAENKRRRNADTFGAERVTLTEEQLEEFRTIPEGKWHPETQLWWKGWTTCAQSQLFTVTDWLRLRELIVTRDSYQLRPTAQKMAELRQTEGLWGATYVDRMKARLKIETPGSQTQEEPPKLAVIADLKKRLAS
jgi:hypothetical protein